MTIEPRQLVALAVTHAATAGLHVDADYEAIRDRMASILAVKDEVDLRNVTDPTPPDHIWRTGDEVEHVRDIEWGPSKGDRSYISDIAEDYDGRSSEYGVFWTQSVDPKRHGRFWTTSKDVRLVKAAADR